MTGSTTQAIKTVLHSGSGLATAGNVLGLLQDA